VVSLLRLRTFSMDILPWTFDPMAFIRKIEVSNFRALKAFSWLPSAGINCLIGPGDTGKSAILAAIGEQLIVTVLTTALKDGNEWSERI
jgi:DNA replication protein DnaC